MPIANCIVTKTCCNQSGTSENLVTLWSEESGKSDEHMTVNIIECLEQSGSKYEVMATLLLPSLWSGQDIDVLQIGLAKALAKHFDISLGAVHVTTHMVQSGLVVEHGELVTW